MPELPEVETTRLGILPHVTTKRFKHIEIRQHQLRWPVPAELPDLLSNATLHEITRRGKYLLFNTEAGTMLLHLGMSGNLRITQTDCTVGKHDHIDFVFDDDTVLRFNDQRRFGAVLWTTAPDTHPLLAELGPEPLSADFNADYLYKRLNNRQVPLKSAIMDAKLVVGVGNIYANEALFHAGLNPNRAAGTLSEQECLVLIDSIQSVLRQAIQQGGTTLRDFLNAQGKPGYFQQSLSVYGRQGLACPVCSEPVRHIKIGQRASYYCPRCQS